MRILMVFESMFGCTERVARAVADGLGGAEVVNVDDAPDDLAGVDLLVVGGPTHVHGLSRASTRQSAAQQTKEEVRSKTGVREWLDSLGTVPKGLSAAAFDTRLDKPRWLTGSAAQGVMKRLKLRGCKLVMPAESFFVHTGSGETELAGGELERAHAWGEVLGAAMRRTVS